MTNDLIIKIKHIIGMNDLAVSSRLKAEKRLKDQQRKQRVTENRKHLANVRVVQKNLVFVVGLPMRLADADVSMINNERSK